jgi:hypothetical protein
MHWMASLFHHVEREVILQKTMDDQNDVVMGGDEQTPAEAPVEETAEEAAPETGEEAAA